MRTGPKSCVCFLLQKCRLGKENKVVRELFSFACRRLLESHDSWRRILSNHEAFARFPTVKPDAVLEAGPIQSAALRVYEDSGYKCLRSFCRSYFAFVNLR